MSEQEFYPRLFNAEDLGQSLKEVAADVFAAQKADVVSRWFHSSKDADLFIWTDKRRNIIKQQLSCYGQVVEWNVVEGLKTGHVVIDEGRGRRRGSEIVRFDQKPQTAALVQAKKVLEHITALNTEERKALLDNFAAGVASTNMDAEEFISRFGSFLERPSAAPQTPLARVLARMKRWLLHAKA
jgi:hypothetical protein